MAVGYNIKADIFLKICCYKEKSKWMNKNRQYAKAGDLEKADESLQAAKETVNEAHHSQTELIQAEIRGEKSPLNLLMVHAQDHLMTALVVIDLAQEFIDVYKKIG